MPGLEKNNAQLSFQNKKDLIEDLNLTNAVKVLQIDELTISVSSFSINDFTFDGGVLDILPNGTWYIGVELSSKQIRSLPRLGHRGWIVVGKIITTATNILSINQITPVMPKCRIPRTMEKLRAGKQIKSLVMGSSLVASSGTSSWSGMVLDGASGSFDKYLLPGLPIVRNIGIGGGPNMYSFAQLGFAGTQQGSQGYDTATYPEGLTITSQLPYGRSELFSDYDLVVIESLANGGDYRLECLEPILRILKKSGIEVIVLTANAQNPSTNYNNAITAGIYIDGPTVMQLADHYGFEIADTAAYVLEAHIRANGSGIYSDTIHMAGGLPNGPDSAMPANGHEVWARALRSIFPIDVITTEITTVEEVFDFTNADINSFIKQGGNYTSLSVEGATLVIEKNDDFVTQWGVRLSTPNNKVVNFGDKITISGNMVWSSPSGSFTPALGMQGGGSGWASNVVAPTAQGYFSIELIANRPATNSEVLFFGNWDHGPAGTKIEITNINISVELTPSTYGEDVSPMREIEIKPLPRSRVVTDTKTPGDAWVILPHQEQRVVSNNTAKGVLGSHPQGVNSFARRFSSQVPNDKDLLTLTPGQEAGVAAIGAVSFAVILYSVSGNPAATLEVISNNNTVVKTIQIPEQTLTREIYFPILTPTEFGSTDAGLTPRSKLIRCTAGTVRIAALVALTAENEILPVTYAHKVGTWSDITSGGGSGMKGIFTNNQGDYLKYKCPDEARRLGWLISKRPNSKPVDLISNRSSILNYPMTGGASHIVGVGGSDIANGKEHIIRCAEGNVDGNSSTGYALHVGGIVIVYDR